jgi:hypothetical protein
MNKTYPPYEIQGGDSPLDLNELWAMLSRSVRTLVITVILIGLFAATAFIAYGGGVADGRTQMFNDLQEQGRVIKW